MLTIVTHWAALLGFALGLVALGYTLSEVIWTWRNDAVSTSHFARVRLVTKLIVVGLIILALFLIAITIGVYR